MLRVAIWAVAPLAVEEHTPDSGVVNQCGGRTQQRAPASQEPVFEEALEVVIVGQCPLYPQTGHSAPIRYTVERPKNHDREYIVTDIAAQLELGVTDEFRAE